MMQLDALEHTVEDDAREGSAPSGQLGGHDSEYHNVEGLFDAVLHAQLRMEVFQWLLLPTVEPGVITESELV